MKTMINLLSLLAIAYFCLCSAMFVYQRKLIYFPQPRAISSQENTQSLATDQAQLVISVAHTHAAQNKAVLYFGGNAEDVSSSLPQLALAFPDRAIYAMHYRGFGGSSGAPTEHALHADALALFDKVKEKHPELMIIGRSLGTGVAVRLASQRAAQGLVLVTPFDSLQELAAKQYPFLPVRWMLQDKFESWRYASKIKMPTMILQAEHDATIPEASTRQLFSRFSLGVARYKVIAKTDHQNILDSQEYIQALIEAGHVNANPTSSTSAASAQAAPMN